MAVSVQTHGLFRDRVGAYFLRPAHTTIYRLVQLRANAPLTVAQKEVPEACSTSFHLTNDEPNSIGTRYTIHSSLKQIPVDPSRSITLQVRVTNGADHLDESCVLNGLSHTEFTRGPFAAKIEILGPDAAVSLLAKNNEPIPTAQDVSGNDWDLLHQSFQLTGQESRIPGWFQLTREASLQFPDIRFSCELIEINDDHSLIKLRGPVQIEWENKNYTSGDAVIRVTADRVQFESNRIQPN